MDGTTVIRASPDDAAADSAANKAIREVASTPSPEHVIPAYVVAFLYRHVDLIREEFFGGQVPEVVLSFDVTDRRTLGHYTTGRLSLGVRWALNLNPVHLARPVYQVLTTVLHELGHNADPGITPTIPASYEISLIQIAGRLPLSAWCSGLERRGAEPLATI